MQCAESTYRESIAHDGSHESVSPVLLLPEPIAMVNAGVPPRERAAPFADMIFHSDVTTQDLVAPAVVITCNPENRHAALAKIGKGGKCAEAAAWNHRLPLEPEVEKIAIDE